MQEMRDRGCFTEENLDFQEKIMERSGLGDETGLTDGACAQGVVCARASEFPPRSLTDRASACKLSPPRSLTTPRP